MRHLTLAGVLVLTLAGCGNDNAPTTTAPTAADPLRALSDALEPTSKYVGAQDGCYPSPSCGSVERRRAIEALGQAGNELFKVANSTAPEGCTVAAAALAAAVVELRHLIEGREPVRAGAAVDAISIEAETYADACRTTKPPPAVSG